MSRVYRLIFPALLAATVLGTTPACAQGYYGRYPQQYPGGGVDDRAYRDGYANGRAAGEDDARRGRSFDYNRHREYRNASGGYGNSYGNDFRRGFTNGYETAYRGSARYGQYPSYPAPAPNVYGTYDPRYGGGYRSPAADNGFRDGYDSGRHDGRSNDRYDPVRESRYRQGDHNYNSRYGSRDAYKRDYRAAFEQGYAQGYREARR